VNRFKFQRSIANLEPAWRLRRKWRTERVAQLCRRLVEVGPVVLGPVRLICFAHRGGWVRRALDTEKRRAASQVATAKPGELFAGVFRIWGNEG
jgi:hypothetical protein